MKAYRWTTWKSNRLSQGRIQVSVTRAHLTIDTNWMQILAPLKFSFAFILGSHYRCSVTLVKVRNNEW